VASVLSEILDNHARFGTRHFAFYDDAFLSGKERHAWPLLEGLSAAALPLSFHSPNGLHLREVDGTTARLLRAAGVQSVYLSLESTDEALMRERSPKDSAEDLIQALRELEGAGYERRAVSVYLIMGLPGQGADSVEESVRFVRGLRATPRVAFFSPIPGTAEWSTLVRRGVLSEDSDPLLHNKTAFAYLKSHIPVPEIAAFKRALA